MTDFFILVLLIPVCAAYFVAYSPSSVGKAAITILSDGADGFAFGSTLSRTVVSMAPGDPAPCFVAQGDTSYLFAVDGGQQRAFVFNSSAAAPWPVSATYESDDSDFIITGCAADDYEFVDITLRNTSFGLTRDDELASDGLTVWDNITGQPSVARSWNSNDTAFVPTLSTFVDRDDYAAMFGVAIRDGPTFGNATYVVGVGCNAVGCESLVNSAPFPPGHQSPVATSLAGFWPTDYFYEVWPLLVLQRPTLSSSTFFTIDQFNANLNQSSGIITKVTFNQTLSVGPVDMTRFPRITSFSLYGNNTVVLTSMPSLSTVFVQFDLHGRAFPKLLKGFAVIGRDN